MKYIYFKLPGDCDEDSASTTSRKEKENVGESEISSENLESLTSRRQIVTRKRKMFNYNEGDEEIEASSVESSEESENESSAVGGTRNKQSGRFTCETCCKTLSSKASLMRHIHTHTREKPYKCDHCPKRFSDPFNLGNHRKIHFAPSLECDICKKKFMHPSSGPSTETFITHLHMPVLS